MQLTIHFDAAPHNGTKTSEAAARRVGPRRRTDFQRILDFLFNCPQGATCDRVEEVLGLRHQTASARMRELCRRGFVYYDGERETRSGHQARIYRICQLAR